MSCPSVVAKTLAQPWQRFVADPREGEHRPDVGAFAREPESDIGTLNCAVCKLVVLQ